MKIASFILFIFIGLLGQTKAQTINLPPEFVAAPSYKNFINGQKISKQAIIQLPQSIYGLVYISVLRIVDKDNWSVSPADGLVAKVFVYNQTTKQIDQKETDQLNRILGADKFYQPNFCGGLGSFENWAVEHKKVVLSQVYAPASEIIDCVTYIFFDGKNIIVSKSPNNNSTNSNNSGLAGMVGKERNQKNAQALQLLKEQKTTQAIRIWQELYGYIKNGPYSTEGNIDEYLNNLGFAYWKNKQYKEAEKVLLECQTRFPAREILLINLADLYRDMKNKPLAIQYYRQIKNSKLNATQKKYAETELKKLKN